MTRHNRNDFDLNVSKSDLQILCENFGEWHDWVFYFEFQNKYTLYLNYL